MNKRHATSEVLSAGTVQQTADAPVVDHKRIEAAVREILAAVGEDPDREGLPETPAGLLYVCRNV